MNYLNLYYNIATLFKQSLTTIYSMIQSDHPEIDWYEFPVETIKDEAQNKLVELEEIIFKELSQLKTANPEEDTGSYW